MRLSVFLFVAGMAGACPIASAFAQQTKVGVVTAVNPQAVSEAPHRRTQPLAVGHNVVGNEKLTTFSKGQVQLLLPDQSSLTIAENSQIVINDVSFDPLSGASQMTATIAKGLVRYVGSKTGANGSVQFRTPSGPVTLRGSSGALIRVKPAMGR